MNQKDDKVRNFQVYKITNLKNNKIYIGVTTRPFYQRVWEHINKPHLSTPIGRAIVKHGHDNFTFEITEVLETKEEMLQKEFDLIEKYRKVLGAKNVYNVLDGGPDNYGKNNPMWGIKHKLSTREKISQKNTSISDDDKREIIRLLKEEPQLKQVEIAKKMSQTTERVCRINKGLFFNSEKFSKSYPIRKQFRVSNKTKNEINKLIQKGLDAKQVSEILNLGHTTVRRYSKYHKTK